MKIYDWYCHGLRASSDSHTVEYERFSQIPPLTACPASPGTTISTPLDRSVSHHPTRDTPGCPRSGRWKVRPQRPARYRRAAPGVARCVRRGPTGPGPRAGCRSTRCGRGSSSASLSVAVSDVFGVTGRDMMRALIAGERDPKVLADLARGSMRGKTARLEKAFTGRFTARMPADTGPPTSDS